MILVDKDDERSQVISNYPNPFASSTSIKVNIPSKNYYTIDVVDVIGNTVKTLMSGNCEQGVKILEWNGYSEIGQELPSGVYYVRMAGNNEVLTQKISIVK